MVERLSISPYPRLQKPFRKDLLTRPSHERAKDKPAMDGLVPCPSGGDSRCPLDLATDHARVRGPGGSGVSEERHRAVRRRRGANRTYRNAARRRRGGSLPHRAKTAPEIALRTCRTSFRPRNEAEGRNPSCQLGRYKRTVAGIEAADSRSAARTQKNGILDAIRPRGGRASDRIAGREVGSEVVRFRPRFGAYRCRQRSLDVLNGLAAKGADTAERP